MGIQSLSSRFFNRFRHNKDDHRTAYFNDARHNRQKRYCSNYLRTSKYTLITFLPLALLLQLRRAANLYFLLIAILATIDSITPYTNSGRYSGFQAVCFVLAVSLIREAIEDFYRFKSDNYFNNSKTEVLRDGEFREVRWKDVEVGNICRITSGQTLPADMILLASSVRSATCYVETANLDGETNLKLKTVLKLPIRVADTDDLRALSGEVRFEAPNDRLFSFEGSITCENIVVPVTISNVLLRGSVLRNTDWAFGFVVYTGSDSKIARNSQQRLFKTSKMEKTTSMMLVGMMGFLIVLCAVCVYFSLQYQAELLPTAWYLQLATYNSTAAQRFLTFLVLLSRCIPMSLYVNLELIKGIQTIFFRWDVDMYDPVTDTPMQPRTSTLNEELGQIEYIFSDKTGTLTRNEMKFMNCSIGGVVYGADDQADSVFSSQSRRWFTSNVSVKSNVAFVPPSETFSDSSSDSSKGSSSYNNHFGTAKRSKHVMGQSLLSDDCLASSSPNPDVEAPQPPMRPQAIVSGGLAAPSHFPPAKLLGALRSRYTVESQLVDEFLTLLAVCHTVLPEKGLSGQMTYQAASPDEEALVKAAHDLGYSLTERTATDVEVTRNGKAERYEVLNVLEFNSERKRMSVIVRTPEGLIKLYVKGADTTIFPRLQPEDPFVAATESHLLYFASQGLRTLCLAMRTIPEEEYLEWSRLYSAAATSLFDREAKVDEAAEIIERRLQLIGATAIEDALQDGVPETILSLRKAGIKIWVLTGDRQETSVNIGFSCGLLDAALRLYQLDGTTPEAFASSLQQTRDSMSLEPAAEGAKPALVIDGETLALALSEQFRKSFMDVCRQCYTVICCRVAPLQKAQVVNMVRHYEKAVTLAIGDGANDVGMIRSAHVGIGISGKEGRQAVLASDYAIAQFRFLNRLLLVHGRWSYQRIARCILYTIYRNLAFALVLFWYLPFNAFSGSTQIESTLLTVFNTVLTSAPIICLSTLDRDTSASLVLANPQLYRSGIKDKEFNWSNLMLYVFSGIFHSVVVFFLPMVMMTSPTSIGIIFGLNAEGVAVYLALAVVTTAKFCLMVRSWTWIVHFFTVVSVAFFLAFLLIYGAPFLASTAPDIVGIPMLCFVSLQFWLTMFIAPFVACIPDIVTFYVRYVFFPSDSDLFLEAYLIQQKAATGKVRPQRSRAFISWGKIKKAYTGFAFSAEPGQANFITQYLSRKRIPSFGSLVPFPQQPAPSMPPIPESLDAEKDQAGPSTSRSPTH